MKKFVMFSVLAVITALSANQISVRGSEAETVTKDAQDVVVHISHFTDDLHRCSMALKLATIMQKSGANVTLFLDIEGVRLADKRRPLNLTWGPSPTPLSEHYDHFVEAQGKVVLCPHCAKVATIGNSDLRANAKIGTTDDLSELLMSADKIMDY